MLDVKAIDTQVYPQTWQRTVTLHFFDVEFFSSRGDQLPV